MDYRARVHPVELTRRDITAVTCEVIYEIVEIVFEFCLKFFAFEEIFASRTFRFHQLFQFAFVFSAFPLHLRMGSGKNSACLTTYFFEFFLIDFLTFCRVGINICT